MRKPLAILEPLPPHPNLFGHSVERIQIRAPHVAPLMAVPRSDSCRLTVVLDAGKQLIHVNWRLPVQTGAQFTPQRYDAATARDTATALARMKHVVEAAGVFARIAILDKVAHVAKNEATLFGFFVSVHVVRLLITGAPSYSELPY